MKKRSWVLIDKGIRAGLTPYFGVIFVLTALGSWQAFLTHSTWHIGDWLINYQGGFVRRGFLGELIYRLSSLTTVSPGFYVFLVQVLLNGLFLRFSLSLLKKQKNLVPYLLLIVSPFLFTFQINSFDHIESQGGYFKECLYCCILAFIAWSAVSVDAKRFEKRFYLTLLFYPLAILTHESFAIFLPFLLIIYVTKVELHRRRGIILCSLLGLSVLSFVLSLLYSGTSAQVAAIAHSLENQYPISTYGSIGWLAMPLHAAIERVMIQIHYNHYFAHYSLIILFSLLAFLPVLKPLQFVFKNKIACFLLLISLLGTVFLCCVAIDWGRFIRMVLVSLFMLSVVGGDACHEKEKANVLWMIATLLLALCYALLWRIPNCCNYRPPISSFQTNNLVWSYVPYKKIVADVIQAVNKV